MIHLSFKIKSKKKRGNTIIFLLLLLLPVIFTHCAKQGTPTGGPKDVRPPEVLEEIPPARTVNFTAKKFTVVFDEFIQLKDPGKEIFISPPMKTKPEYKIHGKKLSVEFQEELKPDATYTINFGNAIVDYTESNPLINYEYVFSTGDHLDSLSIPGLIVGAFDLKPVEGIVAMVYQDDNDSIPFDSLPMRVPPKSASKTTKEGLFSINNLPAGAYRLFALEDLNNNYYYDLPNERIAFIDSLVTLFPPAHTVVMPDTAIVDTSGVVAPVITAVMPDYTLYLFQESDSSQKFLGKKLIGQSLLQYYYRMPVDSFNISPVGFEPVNPDWYMGDISRNRDTLGFWLRPGLPDTIRIRMAAGDSLVDTSRYILTASERERPGRRKETASRAMSINTSSYAGFLDLNKKFYLKFGVPVMDYDSSMLLLQTPADTLIPSIYFSDSLSRQLQVDYNWQPGEAYALVLDDSAFTDLSGAHNDSLIFRFRVRTLEDYGILILNLTVPDDTGQYIIQLLNEKEIPVRETVINSSGQVKFDYLAPGKYKLKATYDRNINGRWDPGKYIINSLPEKVEYYPTTLEIRANWEMQEEWKLD